MPRKCCLAEVAFIHCESPAVLDVYFVRLAAVMLQWGSALRLQAIEKRPSACATGCCIGALVHHPDVEQVEHKLLAVNSPAYKFRGFTEARIR